MTTKALLALAAASLCFVATGAAADTVDCVATRCPEIAVRGDAPAQGRASGYADPSLAHVPGRTRLWMVYSWPHFRETGPRGAVGVDTHLAYSDSSGASWRLAGALWTAEPAPDPVSGAPTHFNTETVTLEATRGRRAGDGDRWFVARTRYAINPLTGLLRPETYEIRVSAARNPRALGGAPFVSLGARSPFNRVDVDLTRFAPELRGCALSNPALEALGADLFLALQCQRYLAGRTRDLEREVVALFSTRPDGPPSSWKWRYRGTLGTRADAEALGGDVLQAVELTRSRSGGVLAIFTVARDSEASFDDHLGCAVVPVASLAKARLVRMGGGPKTIAWVRASDLDPLGPGTCGYDASSRTGVVLARRSLTGGRLTTSLHATGLRP